MTAAGATAARSRGRLGDWWFPAVPRNRIAMMRLFAYVFALVDVFWLDAWAEMHGRLDAALYAPLRIGRILPIPVPSDPVIFMTKWSLGVAAVVALAGRAQRIAGAVVAVCFLNWAIIAMSYGKVDHDRFAFLVLLFLLPTMGKVGFRDRTPDPAAGWVLRMVQIGVVATYVLAAVAKVRFGGWGWVNSATLLRAVLRRGTGLGDWFGLHPEFLHVFQYVMLFAEFAAIVLLIDGRWRRWGVYLAYSFHLVTYATLTIAFYPHLVAMLAFLETDRVVTYVDRLREKLPWTRAPAITASAPTAP